MCANELLRIGNGCGSTVIFDHNYFVLLLHTFYSSFSLLYIYPINIFRGSEKFFGM